MEGSNYYTNHGCFKIWQFWYIVPPFNTFLKNGPTPASFSFIFGLFQTNITNFYNKYMWKNVHPVYGAEIRTHNNCPLTLSLAFWNLEYRSLRWCALYQWYKFKSAVLIGPLSRQFLTLPIKLLEPKYFSSQLKFDWGSCRCVWQVTSCLMY